MSIPFNPAARAPVAQVPEEIAPQERVESREVEELAFRVHEALRPLPEGFDRAAHPRSSESLICPGAPKRARTVRNGPRPDPIPFRLDPPPQPRASQRSHTRILRAMR